MKNRIISLLFLMLCGSQSQLFAADLLAPLSLSRPASAPALAIPARARIESKLQERGTTKVIVRLVPHAELVGGYKLESRMSDAASIRRQRSLTAQVGDRVLTQVSSHHAARAKRFGFIPFVAMEVDQAEYQALAASPDVDMIEEDVLVRPTLGQSVPLIGGFNGAFGGFSGSGQTVAILDTGVDKAHPFLTGKVVSEACYSTTDNSGAQSYCPNGAQSSIATDSGLPCADITTGGCDHGTHVAGIAAGNNGVVSAPSGVAKDANIIAVQIYSRFSSSADCGGAQYTPCAMSYDSDMISGMERVYYLRNTYSIASVNMSLGAPPYTAGYCDTGNESFKFAVDQLRGAGIATVVASGNEDKTSTISFPACISSVISVGATDKQDNVASFSNSSAVLSLLAPGVNIMSSVPGGKYEAWDGTSMATPHVAGAWAVIKSAKPDATVDEILTALQTTGKPVTDSRQGRVTPRIQVAQAIGALNTISLSPATTDLGDIPVNTSSAAKYVTIKNTGAGDVQISAIAMASGSSTMFAAVAGGTCGALPLTIPAGSECTQAVVFTPTAVGPQTTSMQVSSNDYLNPVKEVGLSGGGSLSVSPIRFKDDATSTTLTSVTLLLDYNSFSNPLTNNKPSAMQFLFDKAAAWTAWMPFLSSKVITLTAGTGLRTVSVRFKDTAGSLVGKTSPIYTASIFLDSIAPTGSISLNNGQSIVTDMVDVPVALSVTNAAGGEVTFRLSESSSSWPASWQTYDPKVSYTYTLGTWPALAVGKTVTYGTKKVYVQFQNADGKLSKTYSDTIVYQAPAVVSSVKDSNVLVASTKTAPVGFTNSTAVVATVVNPDPANVWMSFSFDGIKWTTWESVNKPTKSLTLPSGDGAKSVYVRFADQAKVEYATRYRGSIVLDTVAPLGWAMINNGQPVTGSRSVVVTTGGSDVNALASMVCIKETSAACLPGEFTYDYGSANYILTSANDGTKNIYVHLMDNAGKISAALKASIVLDTTAPTGGTVVINSGAQSTYNPTVTLRLSASGAVLMQLRTDGITWGDWEPYATSRTVTLPDGAGLKKVEVCFRDAVGNNSCDGHTHTPASDTITLK